MFFIEICVNNSFFFSVSALFYTFECFSHQRLPIVSHLSLSDSKSPQVSKTLLSILPDLNNAIVWMVSVRRFISEFPKPWINPSVTLPKAPITIGNNATFLSHSFFNSLARSMNLSFFLLSFNYTLLLLLLEFFTSAYADGLLLEFEWQQVSSSLHDSSQYSGRSQQCCSLDGLPMSSNFQVL